MPDFHALREHLPPLSLQRPVDWRTPVADYLRFYRLDFAQRRPGLRQHFGALELAGYRIACHVFVPPAARGTVIVNHGYFDHSGLYDHLFEALLDAGYACVAWDLPGHGLSSGEPATIDAFDEYGQCFEALLAHLAGQLPRPWHGVGQSTGAAILMRYLLRCRQQMETPALQGVALLAPLLRVVRWRWIRAQYWLGRRWLDRVHRVFVDNAGNPGFLEFVRRGDPLQSRWVSVRWVGAMIAWAREFRRYAPSPKPLLVLQGDADGTVDWRYNLPRIACCFPALTVVMVPGGGHHLVNEARPLRQQLFGQLLDWLRRQEAPPA